MLHPTDVPFKLAAYYTKYYIMDQDTDTLKIKFLLNHLHKVIKNGNLEKFKDLIKIMHDIQNKSLLCNTFKNNGINLLGLLCAFKKKTLLSYLLYQSHILHYFTANNVQSEESEYKECAFYEAMCSNHIELLEMLYDYWSGNLHWVGHKMEYNNFDVDNLNQLSISLNRAFKKYEENFKLKKTVDTNMLFNSESLIYFNDFQIDLYTKLNKLKLKFCTWEDEPKDMIRIQETFFIRNIILATLRTYEQHQKKVENIFRTRYKDSDITIEYKANSLIWQTYFYFTHKVYFRKLDLNMCLLILDNIHLLKQRLQMNLYQSLENILYQFNYHVTSNWRLYLPRRKRMESIKKSSYFNDFPVNVTFQYERNIGKRGHYIIYLERRNFEKNIFSFKRELENRNISHNIREPGTKLADIDVNSLMMLPELRDDYSLKRMSQIIAQLYSIDIKNDKEYAYLVIERTLQVVGEFLKSSNESQHLESSTEALLKAEMSVNVIDHLKMLRNMLCHAKKGKLLKRIDLEANKRYIFEKIRTELLYVKTKIDEVIKVHKPFVEKSLIENSLYIMHERKNEMPGILANTFMSIADVLKFLPHDFGQFINGLQESLADLIPLAEEAFFLFIAYFTMKEKLSKTIENIRNNIVMKFPLYRNAITYSLKKIEDHIKEWQTIVKLSKYLKGIILSDYPNEKDTNKIISINNKICKGSNSLINPNQVKTLFIDVKSHWNFICCLLKFMAFFTSIFDYDRNKEIKMFIILQEIKCSLYDANGREYKVHKYLEEIQAELKLASNEVVGLMKHPEFDGIKEISANLNLANFLTVEEKECLLTVLHNKKDVMQATINNQERFIKFVDEMCDKIKSDIPLTVEECERIIKGLDREAMDILRSLVDKRDCNTVLSEGAKTHLLNALQKKKNVIQGQKMKNEKVIQYLDATCNKIKNDIAISMREYNRIILKIFDSKAKRMLKNLVMGEERDPLLPLCLRKRISLLKEIVINQSKSQLITRCKLDKTFRVLLEVVLFDIFDILKDSKVVEKSNNLLTEINLRNILSHGSPLLEVVGNVLDSNDLPTEFVTKALMFVEDEESVIALCELISMNFDFKDINSDNLTSEENELVAVFKTSNRWEDYLLLVPEYKQFKYEQRKSKRNNTVDNMPDLIQAVYKNDSSLVQTCLNQGSDVNFFYNDEKAAIHFAATKGYRNVMDVLLNNNANINIRNKYNQLTALHYCAMYGFKECVDFLLSKGADYMALDGKGRTAVYLANQRKYADISRVLIQAMKRRALPEI